MKRLTIIFLLMVFILAPKSFGAEFDITDPNIRKADSIMTLVIKFASLYESLVTDYRAELYVKGKMHVRKRNQIARFVPSMFRPKKGIRDYIYETYSELHYTAPNIYDRKLTATYGTIDRFRGFGTPITDFFYANIYSTSILNNKLISPLSGNGKEYYTYHIDSVFKENGYKNYVIGFQPRNKSYQLVEGYMVVSDNVWSVREMKYEGRSEYLRFENHIIMGKVGEDNEFVPSSYNLVVRFSFIGNVIDGEYSAVFDYKDIKLEERRQRPEFPRKDKYNLTESYNLQTDTVSHHTDSAYFATLRPTPLTETEEKIYKDFALRRDTTTRNQKPKTPTQIFWGQMGDMFLDSYTLNVSDAGVIKGSPLINPFLMSYSGSDGFSYKQEFKYNQLFKGDRLLRVVPRIGYNFKRSEFYWSVNSDFEYWPRKRASFLLNVGNGNRIYSSDVLDDLKEIPDSIFDFNQLNLVYFRDFFVNFRHRLEIVNGLNLDVGVVMHKRTAVDKPDPTIPELPSDPETADKVRDKYISFAPRIRLEWTPGQYYYMHGDRKINLHSDFPTLSVDWERGIKGILGSTGQYERLELDLQHSIPLGLMRSFHYRVGVGAFTNQEQLYFVDFANFAKNNLPNGWNDEIGGVFQILDRRWYNSSREYARANITYEAPFLLMPRLMRYTRNILNERLYIGALLVPHLNPYLEIGYGIGTHIFDAGIFVSNINGKLSQVGFKFTFELFNR